MAHKWLAVLLVIPLAACTLPGAVKPNDPTADINAAEPSSGSRLAEVNTQLALEYMKQGQNDVALVKLKKAVEADPNFPNAYNVMGLLYTQLGESGKAGESFKRAAGLDAGSPDIMNNYGWHLCRHGAPEEAQKMFATAYDNPLYRTPYTALVNAGTCALDRQQNRDSAEEFFRRALSQQPGLPIALVQMARIRAEQGQYAEAKGYLDRYGDIAAHSPRSLWLGVQIEKQLGNRDAAASYATQLRGKFPDSEETRQMLQSGS